MIIIPSVILAIDSEEDRILMTEIYREYHALMFKTAWAFTKVQSDVEDIVSDGCVSLIEKIYKLRTMNDNELRKYIVITVRNTAINHWNKKQRENARFLKIDEAVEQMPDESSVEGKIAFDDELDFVRQKIHNLSEKEQEILHLKFFQGKTDKEISEIVGIAESSVRKYVERARKRLKLIIYGGAGI